LPASPPASPSPSPTGSPSPSRSGAILAAHRSAPGFTAAFVRHVRTCPSRRPTRRPPDGIARFPRPPRATVIVDSEGHGLWGYAALFVDSDRGAADLFVTEAGSGPNDPDRLGAKLAPESEWPPEASRGLRVEAVAPGGPAARAGLEPGDLIVVVAGDTAAGARQFAAAIHLHQASGRIPLTVLRGGEELELAVELELPANR
jgi:membrane-associated protease RseP (regulator of RpoE activity)